MKLFLAALASVTARVAVVAAARLGKHDDRHGKHDDRHAVPVVLQGPGEQRQNYAATADATGCPDLQGDYDCGMNEGMAGTWIGEDKYYSEDYDYVFDYCSQATWDPNNDENNLEWDSMYLGAGGEGENNCLNVAGVNPLEKTGTLIAEDYELDLNVEQKQCLPASECTFDVLASGEFPGMTVQARACHSHLEVNLDTLAHSCELIQLNLLEDGDGHQDVVAVISYFTFPGGYGNFKCPSSLAYDVDTLKADTNMVGMSRFVLQDPPENVNTDGWCL